MRKYVSWFWQQMRCVRYRILLRIVAGWMQVGIGLLLVWLCRRFIDYVIWQGDIVTEAVKLFAIIALLILLRQFVFYQSNLAEVIQQNVMRGRLFSKVLNRKMYAAEKSDLHSPAKTDLHSGDITQRLDRDLSAVSSITTSVLPSMAVTLVQLLGAFLLMRSIDTILAWSLLVLTPVVAVCAKYLGSRLKKMTLQIRDTESRIQTTIQETAEHELTIKVLQGEGVMTRRINELQMQLRRLVMRRTRFTLLSRLLLAFTFSYGYFGAFVYGAIQLKEHLITFGVMTAFLQLVGQIQGPIMTLLGMIPQLIHATASVDRLMQLEQMPQENQEIQTTQGREITHQNQVNGDAQAYFPMGVRLEHVSFRYPDGTEKTILQDFSHDFKPGTSTAIMGETGRGKTTILRLIADVAVPTSGKLLFYDELGDEMSGDSSIRDHIVYIEQGNTLLSGSVRDNLLLAKPDATEKEMQQALYIANAEFVNSLPNGIDTMIGEHATKLSGGQAQRIAIARGLLRPGSVLLLDEVSSSLDSDTESELFARLFAGCLGKTIICVTHRQEAAKYCREILRLE